MKKLIFLIFIVLSNLLHAQSEFAPIGAEWYYSEPYSLTSMPSEQNYILFRVVGDTIINEMNSKKIELLFNGTTALCVEFIAQIDDTIYYFNTNTQQFQVLYNFSANIGEIITVHHQHFIPNCGTLFNLIDSVPNFQYKIVNIDSIFISERWLKRQTVEMLNFDDYWGFGFPNGQYAYILEGIGSLTYFFGRANAIIPEMSAPMLRCYSDNIIEYKNEEWIHDCFYVTNLAKNNFESNDIYVYPTIFSDEIFFKYNIKPINQVIEILDSNGNEIIKVKGEISNINTIAFAKGIYFIKIHQKDNSINSFKIIKL